jgi:hypothetical protein
MMNSFVVDAATGLPTIMTNSATWNAFDGEYDAAKTATMTVDPRMDWTAGRDGVPFKDWGPHNETWIRNIPNGGPYSAKKNVHEKASGAQSSVGWVNTQLNSVNIHMLRYADVLLMLAEAEVEAGSLTNALDLVNQVRARAAVKAQGPGTSTANIAVPINDPSITWAIYKVSPYPSFPDKTYAREAVRTERKIELALEGHRFFDLKRYNIATPSYFENTLNNYMTGVGGGKENTRRSYVLTAAGKSASRQQVEPGTGACAGARFLFSITCVTRCTA